MTEIRQRNTEFSFIHHFIVVCKGKDIGFCQYYTCMHAQEECYEHLDMEGLYSIDYGIGEEIYLRKGIGKQIVQQLTQMVFLKENANCIAVQPDEKNEASRGTLVSSGYTLINDIFILSNEEFTRQYRSNRKVYMHNEDLELVYTKDSDRRLIYDMAFEEDMIILAMLPAKEYFPIEKLLEEEDYFFGEEPGDSKYLLICYQDRIVGTISHTRHDGKVDSMELDIWLRSVSYTNRGIGYRAMSMLIKQLVKDFGINTFLIRPWKRNKRAIAMYQKCGFQEKKDFKVEKFYTTYLKEEGAGDVPGETLNMVLHIK